MKYVPFGDTGLEVSVLGFGCAPMGSRFGPRESRRALSAAYESGVTLFDTGRAYGQGDSERILGDFLRGKRDRVVVSTKFGMTVPPSTPARRLVKAAARPVFRVAPGLRRAAAPALGAQLKRGAFSPTEMRASVDQSLRDLRCDYIDILFIHSCTLDALEDDALFVALDGLVRSGKVRHFGVAGAIDVINAALRRRRDQVRAVQFHQSLLDQRDATGLASEPNAAGVGAIAHQPFGGGAGLVKMRVVLEAMGRADDVPESLRRRLQHIEDGTLTDLAVNGVLSRTGVHSAVGSMFTVEHVRNNARIAGASRFSDEEIAAVQSYFRARVRTG